jgi:ABC-type branched-subunit amino acid transport system permease subunit
VLGAFILVCVPEVLRFAPEAVAQNRMLIFAVVVILLMIFNPQGISQVLLRLVRKPRQA